MPSRWEKFATILVIVVGIIPIVTQFSSQGDSSSLILLGAIFLVILIYFISDYVKDKLSQVDKVVEKIAKMEEKVDYMKSIHELDKRVSLIEEKKKKGQVDPRLAAIVILLVLLYLYLRSIGILS
ncbi:MAG: hypothetical protein HYT73_02945 [Candidatus Aenigmarchaeota archaeon]|nr:hypothetical protein [Candidatus Aenigmarchaeota archaeon]